MDLTKSVEAEGFVLLGVTPAVEAAGFSDLVRWIDLGYAADMDYLANRLDAYRHPRGVMEGTRSVIALAFPYAASNDAPICGKSVPDESALGEPTGPTDPTATTHQGRVARYAWSGVDYHDVIHPKLKRIIRSLRSSHPELKARGVVDTAPLMEREIAEICGLGWRGKNTLLLNPRWGSYFFLACILVDCHLPATTKPVSHHCGTCTACLDACPTEAFVSPGVLDAGRCISYLTIENQGPIPEPLRSSIGQWVFGCDVCQEVCPWNRKRARTEPCPEGAMHQLELHELFDLDDDSFRARFRKTPMWRTRRRGLLRNAAIVLGNQRQRKSFVALKKGLEDDEPIVRGASAWALGQLGHHEARQTLTLALPGEHDPGVRDEIVAALSRA